MWGDIDFSRLHLSVCLDSYTITVLNAKQTVFLDSFPDHRHGFYELHYIFGGRGTLICEGNHYPLRERMLYLNGPNVSHEQLTDHENVMMEYSVSFDLKPARRKKAGLADSGLSGPLSDVTLWIGEDHSDILTVFQRIEEEIQHKQTGYYEVIRCLFELLILKLIRNFSEDSHADDARSPSAGDRRKFIMDEAFIYNYKDMSLPFLAKLVNLSERQTLRNIRQYYGVSFSEYRQISRLNAAARILQADNAIEIGTVAEQVGFSSEAHFRKLFREKFGVTPRKYRAAHRKGNG